MAASGMFSSFLQGWRSWKHARGVALLAIAALAVGIGSTTAIYSVVHAVLLTVAIITCAASPNSNRQ